MFCPNCGTQLPEGSQFCAGCGTPKATSQTPAAPEIPVTPEAAVVPEAPVAPKKTKKKSKLPVIIALVLVVALVAAAVWLIFFSKKTVYLVESYESVSYGGSMTSRTTIEYEYDDLGKLLSYSSESEYTGDYSYEYGWNIGYEYTKDGLLESAEWENSDSSIEYEYTFNDDGILEEVTGENKDGSTIEVSCDGDGRIESVKYYDADGNVTSETTFEYDDDGKLAEKKQVNGSYVNLFTYENNKIVEQVTKNEDEVQYRSVYAYDERGNMTEMTSYGQDNELTSTMKFEYTYEKDKLMELVIKVEDGDGNEYEVIGEVEWDGDEEAVIELSMESGESDSFPEDAEIELTYDKHGNLLTVEMSAGGEVVMEQNYSYVEVKVPRDYEEFWNGDPIWMINN